MPAVGNGTWFFSLPFVVNSAECIGETYLATEALYQHW